MTAPQRPTTPAGYPATVWADRIAAAPALDVTELAPAGARLLVVSAHPDDETIGAGRLIAAWAAHVGPVDVVLLTTGEACLDHLGERPVGIVERRLAEWEAAVADLGATPLGCAHLPDGGLTGHLDDIAEIVRTLSVAHAALAAPWFGDPHPDHAAAGAATAEVAREVGVGMLGFPIWTTYWATPDDVTAPLTRLAVDPAADAARALALTRFPSQTEPLRPGLDPVVPAAMLAHHHAQLLLGEPR